MGNASASRSRNGSSCVAVSFAIPHILAQASYLPELHLRFPSLRAR